MAIDASGDGTVELPDGRHLGWAAYGDPDGRPVLYFGGTAASRLEGELYDVAARAHATRIVAVERPGAGRSTPHPGRTLADWARDIDVVVRSLALDGFAVLGYSGGGPHALACAVLSEPAPRACVLVNCVPPARIPEVQRLLDRRTRTVIALNRRAPGLARATLGRAILGMMRREDDTPPKRFLAQLTPEDRARYTAPGFFAAQRATMQEGFRQGPGGMFDEWEALWRRPWSFDPRQVRSPLHVLSGQDDSGLPWAQWLVEGVPFAALETFLGGHFSFSAPAALDLAVRSAAAASGE